MVFSTFLSFIHTTVLLSFIHPFFRAVFQSFLFSRLTLCLFNLFPCPFLSPLSFFLPISFCSCLLPFSICFGHLLWQYFMTETACRCSRCCWHNLSHVMNRSMLPGGALGPVPIISDPFGKGERESDEISVLVRHPQLQTVCSSLL